MQRPWSCKVLITRAELLGPWFPRYLHISHLLIFKTKGSWCKKTSEDVSPVCLLILTERAEGLGLNSFPIATVWAFCCLNNRCGPFISLLGIYLRLEWATEGSHRCSADRCQSSPKHVGLPCPVLTIFISLFQSCQVRWLKHDILLIYCWGYQKPSRASSQITVYNLNKIWVFFRSTKGFHFLQRKQTGAIIIKVIFTP